MDIFEEQENQKVSEYVEKIPNNQELGNLSRSVIKKNKALSELALRFPNDQDLGKEIRSMFKS